MSDTFLVVLDSVALALATLAALFNFNTGIRRLRIARNRGEQVSWHRQRHILSGIELCFLALLFLSNFAFWSGHLNQQLADAFVIICAALVLLVLGRSIFLNVRSL